MKIMLIFLTFLFSIHPKICVAGNVLEVVEVYKSNKHELTEKTRIELPNGYQKIVHDHLNEKIGTVYPPYSFVTQEKWMNKNLLFRARYSLSAFGLRTFNGKAGTRHLIIAGDSNVFGEGCNDNETLFAFLDPEIKDARLYNLGHRGGGPHNTLSLVKNYPALSLVKEPKGLFLYNFFPTHMIERVIGGKNYSGWDSGLSPWYSLSEKDELVANGPFKNRSMTQIYKWMAGSDFLNWLFPNLPRIGKKHLHLVAKVFEQLKKQYLQQFPEGHFLVVLNLSSLQEDRYSKDLENELKQLNIETVTVGPVETDLNRLTFPDGHFNPEGQRLQADLLKKKYLEIFFLK